MGTDLGKIFVDGLSWETTDDSLRNYFQNYGDVLEAQIIKDRKTGITRRFGFVSFADPTVAERVVMNKYTIDGHVVQAKRVIRYTNGQRVLDRQIFVGGLGQTVTEHALKNYFDRFGTIIDLSMKRDQNQNPRGFAFITYDSEDAANRALLDAFHNINGKKVEVKRAIHQKRRSSDPTPMPIVRSSNFGGGYTQGFGWNSIWGNDMRMGSNVSGGHCPFPNADYRIGLNTEETIWNPNPIFCSNLGYSNSLSYPFRIENAGRYKYNSSISSGDVSGNHGYGIDENNYQLRDSNYGRSNASDDVNSSYAVSDVNQHPASSQPDGSSPLQYGHGNADLQAATRTTSGYNERTNAVRSFYPPRGNTPLRKKLTVHKFDANYQASRHI